MSVSFQEILNSRLFKFIVGENIDGESTEFFVYEEALAQPSKPLYNLMRGGMIESQAGCARWDDVGKETFERFVQFAYTGDYSVPQTEHRPAENQGTKGKGKGKKGKKGKTENAGVVETIHPEIMDSQPDITAEPELAANLVPEPRLFSVHLNPYSQNKPNFRSLHFELASRDKFKNTCDPIAHFDQKQSYSDVFLGHASLYVLRDFQLIHSLKVLALYKLHQTLCIFQLNEKNTEDVIDLARFAYSEKGGGGEVNGRNEGLRSLVCRYIAENAKILYTDDRFQKFLEGGQFVKDLFKFVIERV